MSDKPILFSGAMVRALLNGTKTQTRRVLKPQPPVDCGPLIVGFYHPTLCNRHGEEYPGAKVFGASSQDGEWATRIKNTPKDQLWVRETWQGLSLGDYLPTKIRSCEIRYAATDPLADLTAEERGYPWRPSIFMPRWVSRITLTIIDVQVERLQDITEADAVAEGVLKDSDGYRDYLMPHTQCCNTAKDSFCTLWDSINGHGAWANNPWVAVYTFLVHQRNIDRFPEAAE